METCASVLPLKRSDRIRQLIVILISHNAQTVKTKPEIIGIRHGESIPADDVQMAKGPFFLQASSRQLPCKSPFNWKGKKDHRPAQ